YQVPNIPHPDSPIGKDEDENVQIKVWGDKPKFDFPAKDHVELMLGKDIVDFERGAKAHGFRGYFLKNDGARLSWAIWNYAMDFYSQRGFEIMIAPAIVRPQFLYGTGHLPNDAEDIFKTQDDDYLAGTAEVPMMAYHSDEILDFSNGPKKYLCFSPCYRREAGSYSKDTKGLIRVHEFFKWEQLVFAPADQEQSLQILEELRGNLEEFIESLGIPYETVDACTGDMGQGKIKMYDTNLWVPSQEKYREISSASYFGTFQCRRLNTRYRNHEGKLEFADSLNSTAIPTPRSLVALVENFQQVDGSIKVPEVLVPYFGKSVIS
ncbi:MAG: serine--tRNA ligase, partial [Bacteroidota bacterium]